MTFAELISPSGYTLHRSIAKGGLVAISCPAHGRCGAGQENLYEYLSSFRHPKGRVSRREHVSAPYACCWSRMGRSATPLHACGSRRPPYSVPAHYAAERSAAPTPEQDELLVWDRDSQQRFTGLLDGAWPDVKLSPYASGYWSVAYAFDGAYTQPDLQELRGVLDRAVGHEAGWPPWWVIAPRMRAVK